MSKVSKLNLFSLDVTFIQHGMFKHVSENAQSMYGQEHQIAGLSRPCIMIILFRLTIQVVMV